MASTFLVREIDPDRYEAFEADAFRDNPVSRGVYRTGAEAVDVLRAIDADTLIDYVFNRPRDVRHRSAALDPDFPPGYAVAGIEPAGVTMATVAESEVVRVCRGAFAGLKLTVTVVPSVNYTTSYTHLFGSSSGSDQLTEGGNSVTKLTLTRTGPQGKLRRNHERRSVLPTSGVFTLGATIASLAPTSSQAVASVSQTTQAGVTTRTTFSTGVTTTTTTSNQVQNAGPGVMRFAFLQSATGRPMRLYFRATASSGTYNEAPEYSLWLVAPLASGDTLAFYEVGNYDSVAGTYGHRPPAVTAVDDPSNRTTTSNVIAIDEAGPSVFGVATRVWGWRTEIIHDYDNDSSGADRDYHDHGTEYRTPSLALVELPVT